MVRKAVIPAAGLGTRFLPATKAAPKEMLPVVDKPGIQYVVEEAVRAGIRDVLIITGRGKRSVEDHFDRSFELEYYLERQGKQAELAMVQAINDLADIHYVRQGEPRGLGHAIGVARGHVGNESFAVLLPDDLMLADSPLLEDMIAAHDRTGGSVLALKEMPGADISHYGSVRPGKVDGPLVEILELVEKPRPEEAPSNLAIMGRYVFTPEIFEAIDRTPPGKGGEIQITDAVGLLLGRQPVYGYTFVEGRFDTGNKVDWLRATIEFALTREDLGPQVRDFLRDICQREGWA